MHALLHILIAWSLCVVAVCGMCGMNREKKRTRREPQADAMARYRRERLECERRREQARMAVESGQVYQWN